MLKTRKRLIISKLLRIFAAEKNKNSKPSLTRLKHFIMTALDFNDRGQANVSFGEFDNYMNERMEHGDYTEEKDGITYYYNCGGCLLAKYDNNEGYGFTY